LKKNKRIEAKIVSINPKEKLIFSIGLALFGLLLMVIFAEFHIKTTHLTKIKSLSQVKLDLTSAHLDFEDIIGKAYLQNKQYSPIIDVKKQLKYLLLPPNLSDKILPLYSQSQHDELESILKQVDEFEALCSPEKYATNILQHDALFNTLITRITNLQNEFNSAMRHQSSQLTIAGWVLFGLLLLYLLFTLLYIINFRKFRDGFLTAQHQLLETLKQNNYFLEESQNVSKLGYYTYDFNTKQFDASKYLTDLMGLNAGIGNLQSWIAIIHPEDRFILEDALKQRLRDEATPLDVTYRVIKPLDGKVYWMHHTAQALQKDTQGHLLPVLGVLQDITEHKLFELSLTESESLLNKMQTIAKLGSFDYDILSRKGSFTKECAEITGFKNKNEISFDEWLTIVHPDDQESNQKAFDLCKREGANYDQEYRIITKDKQELKWLHGLGTVVFKDGIAKNFMGTIQDITQRKLAEEKLKQSDTILNKLSPIVLVVNDIGEILYASPSIKDSLGFESSDMLGQGWWQLTYENLTQANLIKEAVLGYFFKNKELLIDISLRKLITKNGEEKWFEWRVSRGFGNTYISIGIDVTQRKLAEEKLMIATKKIAESENRFREIFEKSGDAILIIKNEQFIDCNQAAIKMLGYNTKEEFINTHPSKLSPEFQPDGLSSFQKAQTMMQTALDHGTNRFEWRHTKKNGEVFPVEVLLTAISNEPDNRLIHCVWRDITELEREAQIKEIIYNITKKASSTLNIEKLFVFIKSELQKLINTNNFFIALYDKTSDMISTPFMVDEQDEGSDFPKGKTLTGYLIDTKKSLLASQQMLLKLQSDHKVEILGPLSKCWLGVPLIIGKKAIGAIVIQSYTDERAYSQKDLELLELVASNIGQVIKQVRDFEKINLLNQAVVQSPESIVVTNAMGEIQFANPAFTKLSGYTQKEALGKTHRLLKSDKHDSTFYKNLWQTILKGETWEGELVNKKKDGSNYLVKANISPVKNKAGLITNFVSVQEDITEKRKLERDFINAFIDAQEQEKISFGEDLHDGISQILSAESMYIEVLNKLNKSDDKRITEALDKIRTLNLDAINDARGIAHGLMSKQLKENGLIMAINHICNDYNQSRKIKFNFIADDLIEDEISKEIKINLFRIAQEISTNIVRHSGAKNSEITLAKTNLNQLQLIIKDDGVGIDLEKMKREHKGAGLKNIERRVSLLNGKLNLETAPNQGTCYTIVVPLANL